MKHLFFPNPINKANKRKNTAAQNMPAAISSEAYRAFLQQKEEQKQEKELRKTKKKICVGNTRKIAKTSKNERKLTKKVIDIESKQKCGMCNNELYSDVEDDEKNVGCDKCPVWYHLKCTEFVGHAYDEICDTPFTCFLCS